MSRDTVSGVRRELTEVFVLIDSLQERWKDDPPLQVQAAIANQHVRIALDALSVAESICARQRDHAG